MMAYPTNSAQMFAAQGGYPMRAPHYVVGNPMQPSPMGATSNFVTVTSARVPNCYDRPGSAGVHPGMPVHAVYSGAYPGSVNYMPMHHTNPMAPAKGPQYAMMMDPAKAKLLAAAGITTTEAAHAVPSTQ